MKWLAGILGVAVTAAVMQEPKQEPRPRKRQPEERVWVQGHMVCIGCTLAKEHGVDAQCTLHARHALGFQDAEGRIWTLVDNLRGHGVITNTKLRDQDIRVLGWQYPKHQYLELWRYALAEDGDWIDWDHCRTCGWELGDHQGKELCPNCEDGE